MAPAPRPLCFVTGASGFLGRRTLEILTATWPDLPLRALVHTSPVTPRSNTEMVHGSLEDEAALPRLLEGVHTVLHFAAVTHSSDPARYLRVNAMGTAHLARAARQAGVRRFILISSRAIRPECGDYARSKLQGEDAIRTSGLPYVILRFSEVYGPGTGEGLNALIALVRRLPVVPYPAGPVTLAPLFVEDAVRAVLAVVDRPHLEGEVYTLAGPQVYTFRETVQVIAKAFSRRRLLLPVPLGALALAARVSSWIGRPIVHDDQINRLRCAKDSDIDRARRDLGFIPVAFPEGLQRIRRGEPFAAVDR